MNNNRNYNLSWVQFEVNNPDKEKNKDDSEEDEILTETQRLQLIYGNVVPLHERRRRGRSRARPCSRRGP